MDYRTDSFVRRFRSATSHLLAPDFRDLASLKYRSLHSVGYQEYEDLVRHLKDLGLDVEELNGDFGGRAWLIKDQDENRAILVEHETGLEILYVAGSVASLIALLPLISSGWNSLRSRLFPPRSDPGREGVEVRQFGKNEVLIEHRAPNVEVYVLNATLQDHALLRQKVERLENLVNAFQDGHPKIQTGKKKKKRGATRRRKGGMK